MAGGRFGDVYSDVAAHNPARCDVGGARLQTNSRNISTFTLQAAVEQHQTGARICNEATTTIGTGTASHTWLPATNSYTTLMASCTRNK